MIEESREYWEAKFRTGQDIWGVSPSKAARLVIEDLARRKAEYGVMRLLDVGCGYGRDTNYFVQCGIGEVRGVDFSREAVGLAKTLFPLVDVREADVLAYEDARSFDVIFCNFLIHLFAESRRKALLQKLHDLLGDRGVLYATVSSDQDPDFRAGERIAPNTVRNRRGVVKFFYDDERVREEFGIFAELDFELFREEHFHETRHTHVSYLVRCRKE